MLTLKKLLFAPLFLIFLYLSLYFLVPFLNQTSFLFSFDLNTFKSLSLLTFFIFLAGYFFIVFASLANDYKLVVPVSILGSFLVFLFKFPSPYIAFILLLVIFLTVYWSLNNTLKSYLNFSAVLVLGPSTKALSKLLVLVVVLIYLFTVSSLIAKNGFQIPDSLLNAAVSSASPTEAAGSSSSTIPNLTPDQIALLKQHPEILKQYGLTPQTLDQAIAQNNSSKTTTDNSTVKNLVNAQFQQLIKPYLPFIPFLLALVFLVTLYSFLWIILIFTPVFLWVIFKILEEVNFIHFEKETREVKKMTV